MKLAPLALSTVAMLSSNASCQLLFDAPTFDAASSSAAESSSAESSSASATAASTGGAASSSGAEATATSSASTGAGGEGGSGPCGVQCGMCFGACDCGVCQVVTVPVAGSSLFVSAAPSVVIVGANQGAIGSAYRVSKAGPAAVLQWSGTTVEAITTWSSFGYVAERGRIWLIPAGLGVNTQLTQTLDMNRIHTSFLRVVQFPGGSQLCFVNGGSFGAYGGLYCQPTNAVADPIRLCGLDNARTLTSAMPYAMTVYQGGGTGAAFYKIAEDGQQNLAGIPGYPILDLVAVDGGALAWLGFDGTVVLQPVNIMMTQITLMIPGAIRLKLAGNYLYVATGKKIRRFLVGTGVEDVSFALDEPLTLTDFDVDPDGVYWVVPGAGLRMRGFPPGG
jgi:hypothetical protein